MDYIVSSYASMVAKARTFAIAAHHAVGQKRKYTGESYTVHLKEVVSILVDRPHTPEMLAAAWLHDTVEDTQVDIELIRDEFGSTIADYVFFLTDKSKPVDGNRATRKEIDLKHLAAAPREVHTIKLADIISNTSSIVEHDPDFARVYLREKQRQLEVLTDGDYVLWLRAKELVEEWIKHCAS
jgi:(p)ppGpp synthase/HD superfamily hydrolase